MSTLATKYRPKEFSDVCGQKSIIKIFEQQLKTRTFKNFILMCGPSGCGKTTLARIFANKINNTVDTFIEMDAASNNSVEDMRRLIDLSSERSLDSEYKIIILDEVHMLSTQAFNTLLKFAEETPKYTIVILCTTDPQKIPQTIINRCQIFNLSRIDDRQLLDRLRLICIAEGYHYSDIALDYIIKLSNGSARQSITYLDKCKDYSTDISIDNVKEVLGDCSYDTFFDLVDSIVDDNKPKILKIIDSTYNNGTDLKLFISNFLSFVLQLTKFYILKGDMSSVNIPESYIDRIKYSVGIENGDKYLCELVDKLLKIKQAIKADSDIKTTVEIMLLN